MTTEKRQAGVLVPVIDRTKCDGGFHHECKEKAMPCIVACPHAVLEIRSLRGSDKKGLSFGERLRILVHKNRQAYVVRPGVCNGCGECVKACPPHAIKLKRPGCDAGPKPLIFAKHPPKGA
jgi:NAD-dependent dihydropyrimidine dehydrogenase PreA subunit